MNKLTSMLLGSTLYAANVSGVEVGGSVNVKAATTKTTTGIKENYSKVSVPVHVGAKTVSFNVTPVLRAYERKSIFHSHEPGTQFHAGIDEAYVKVDGETIQGSFGMMQNQCGLSFFDDADTSQLAARIEYNTAVGNAQVNVKGELKLPYSFNDMPSRLGGVLGISVSKSFGPVGVSLESRLNATDSANFDGKHLEDNYLNSETALSAKYDFKSGPIDNVMVKGFVGTNTLDASDNTNWQVLGKVRALNEGVFGFVTYAFRESNFSSSLIWEDNNFRVGEGFITGAGVNIGKTFGVKALEGVSAIGTYFHVNTPNVANIERQTFALQGNYKF